MPVIHRRCQFDFSFSSLMSLIAIYQRSNCPAVGSGNLWQSRRGHRHWNQYQGGHQDYSCKISGSKQNWNTGASETWRTRFYKSKVSFAIRSNETWFLILSFLSNCIHRHLLSWFDHRNHIYKPLQRNAPLKPKRILESTEIWLIDFGSAHRNPSNPYYHFSVMSMRRYRADQG